MYSFLSFLVLQVGEVCEMLSAPHRMRTVLFHGGVPYPPQQRALKDGVDILVGTPGRIIDHLNGGTLDLSEVRTAPTHTHTHTPSRSQRITQTHTPGRIIDHLNGGALDLSEVRPTQTHTHTPYPAAHSNTHTHPIPPA